jgi:hypothetical protein
VEEYRQTKITLKQLNGVKMVVLEVKIDKETGIESYRLLYDYPRQQESTFLGKVWTNG